MSKKYISYFPAQAFVETWVFHKSIQKGEEWN